MRKIKFLSYYAVFFTVLYLFYLPVFSRSFFLPIYLSFFIYLLSVSLTIFFFSSFFFFLFPLFLLFFPLRTNLFIESNTFSQFFLSFSLFLFFHYFPLHLSYLIRSISCHSWNQNRSTARTMRFLGRILLETNVCGIDDYQGVHNTQRI